VSTIHTIGIAGISTVKAPQRVRTVLGSCVGIALFDRKSGVGGMAHIILPTAAEGSGDPGKFADSALPLLLEKMFEQGAVRGRIAAKIAGGARMFGPKSNQGLGERNVAAVKDQLQKHAVPMLGDDCGGDKGRKITLDPATGNLEVQIIGQEPRTL